MKVLITGAHGMVGRNLLEHPAINSYELLTPSRAEVNLLQKSSVISYLESNRPDAIIHCAAKVGGIQANLKSPVSFLIENLDIGRNLIYSASQIGIPKLINVGSSCMYPRGHEDMLEESYILTGELEPTNEAYALAKILAAKLCQYLNSENSSVSYKTIIPCNLYGRYDNFEPERSHLIPAIIHKLHQAKIQDTKSVEIWGDGSARREFMDAADLADCLVQCLERYDEVPEIMNVGLGLDFSVKEYYQMASDVIGFKGNFTYNLDKPVGMKRKIVAIDKLNRFGWKAKINLHLGLDRTYNYYKSLKLD